jgi:hypothetical protein
MVAAITVAVVMAIVAAPDLSTKDSAVTVASTVVDFTTAGFAATVEAASMVVVADSMTVVAAMEGGITNCQEL